MKWILVFMLSTMAAAQTNGTTSTVSADKVCSEQQGVATKRFIDFCIKYAPNSAPSCSMTGHDPRESMWAAQSGPAGKKQKSYFEVLDCSWHYGENPRTKLK